MTFHAGRAPGIPAQDRGQGRGREHEGKSLHLRRSRPGQKEPGQQRRGPPGGRGGEQQRHRQRLESQEGHVPVSTDVRLHADQADRGDDERGGDGRAPAAAARRGGFRGGRRRGRPSRIGKVRTAAVHTKRPAAIEAKAQRFVTRGG